MSVDYTSLQFRRSPFTKGQVSLVVPIYVVPVVIISIVGVTVVGYPA